MNDVQLVASVSECARILKETFTLKSQINQPVKIRTGHAIMLDGDVLHEIVVNKSVRTVFECLRAALPANAYLVDDRFSGGVLFPAYSPTMAGDVYLLLFGSDDWPSLESGGIYPSLNAHFRKDPVTWKLTCELVPDKPK